MAKEQKRSNKEIRKPKSTTGKKAGGEAQATVSTAFGKPGAKDMKPRKK